ncbi:MAG: macro domain-containing protein [Tetragenococcus koreensis]|nr:macro domain-containing protein [Tetragenococcus koreensis]MDN6183743.1 macro domain-containing protein [Lactococcus lactis]MDN6146138.1 macro domain-containing protein [Tetragenococcus koreensis]MDN6266528.1 macro domain-containing protein [Tetragenococcus koreensis]MDN6392233.1 macro domain-containing protein [Lactococcus lactis]
MALEFVYQDITQMNVNAIVNAANKQLQGGSGVCGAIFKAAGWQTLQKECNQLAPIQTGEAVVTSAGNLAASYVIHTAGPIYHGGDQQEAHLLAACYRNSLIKAVEKNCESVAFPLISTGVYGFPQEAAVKIAIDTIQQFLKEHELTVYLVFFDQELFAKSKVKYSF